MKSKAQSAISPVIAAYDFSTLGTIADMAVASGTCSRRYSRRHRNREVLFDQPHVIERVEADEQSALD